jgi:hypothetical protein
VLPSLAKLNIPVTQDDLIALNGGLIKGLTNSTSNACFKALTTANTSISGVLTLLNELSEGKQVQTQLATAVEALVTELSNAGDTTVCDFTGYGEALQNVTSATITEHYLFHGSAINADINNLNDPNGTYAEAGNDLGNALYLLTGVALGGTSSY